MQYVDTKKAMLHYGVTIKTLQRWDKNGKIQTKRTKGGHRRYCIPNTGTNNKFIYARVSSSKQKEDLQRQIQFLQQKYPSYTVVTDIGSGINFKRRGFNSLLDKLFDGDVKEIAIASPDRFCRFGFEFFKKLFKRFGATISVAKDKQHRTFEQELTEDLLSIITVFTARYHGARKYSILSENKDISI
jgi:putative resolvase